MQSQLKSFSKYSEIKRYNRLPNIEKKAIQDERLKKLLIHSYNNVPYYTKTLREAGVVIDGEVLLENFNNIPILDKKTIRENFEDLTSAKRSNIKTFLNTSGGSTGEPIRFLQDEEYASWNMAVSRVFTEYSGYRIPNKRFILWGSERDSVKPESFRRKLGLWLQGITFLNAYNIGEKEMNYYISLINKEKPYLIHAYAESLYQFAVYLDKNNIKIFSPNAIITSAGTLMPHMRELIEKIFKTKIYNMYGSREVGAIACESNSHDGLHISTYTQYVELMGGNNDKILSSGSNGEVIVTSLTNYSMPLIRYKIGDLASWSKNSTGIEWNTTLENVAGRVSDNFIAKNGKITFGAYFRHLLLTGIGLKNTKSYRKIMITYLSI